MINAVVDINSVGGEEFLKQIGGPGKCQGRRREVTFQLDFDSKCVRRGGGVEGWRKSVPSSRNFQSRCLRGVKALQYV